MLRKIDLFCHKGYHTEQLLFIEMRFGFANGKGDLRLWEWGVALKI